MVLSIPPFEKPPILDRPFHLIKPIFTDASCVICLLPEIDSTWRDQTFNGNDGTIVNATKIDYSRWGNAMSFNGTDTRVNVADSAELDGFAAMTLCLWAYQTTYHANGMINKNTADGYLLQGWSDQKMYWAVNGSTDRAVTAAGVYPLSEWYHVAAVSTGTYLQIYINGSLKKSQAKTTAVPASAAQLVIGRNNDAAPSSWFNGYIDEVIIFNKALTADEILELYNLEKDWT